MRHACFLLPATIAAVAADRVILVKEQPRKWARSSGVLMAGGYR